MSEQPPPEVINEPGRSHVLFERSEVPLTVDERAVALAGDLTWHPPPSLGQWIAAAAVLAALFAVSVFSR